MRRTLSPWFLVVALSTIGVGIGHQTAYLLTDAPTDALHGYLSHLPQVALLATLLSLIGACFVERRANVALWPFPVVMVAGFVLQEHLERLAHSGSFPALLDEPTFLIGLIVQFLLGVVCWMLARLLVRIVGRAPRTGHPCAPHPPDRRNPASAVTGRVLLTACRPRAPPLVR